MLSRPSFRRPSWRRSSSCCPKRSCCTSVEYTLQGAEELLPAVVRTLIGCLLVGTEAGLLHADVGAALGWSQRPEDDPLQPGFASSDTPVIGQALERVDDQHLAVDDPIPVRHGVGPELELPPDRRLEVVVHHPLREERA